MSRDVEHLRRFFDRQATEETQVDDLTTALQNRNYDITSDGMRLLVQVPDRTNPASHQIFVVLNWFAELKRLVPAK